MADLTPATAADLTIAWQDRTAALVTLAPGTTATPAMNRFSTENGLTLARLAPNQILACRDGTGSLIPELATYPGATLIDLSDARVALRLQGPAIPRLLTHLLPLDLHGFAPGHCAQTLMAHLNVLLLCHTPDTYELQCGRSFAGSFHRAVTHAAGLMPTRTPA